MTHVLKNPWFGCFVCAAALLAGASSRFLCSEQDTLAFQITVYSRDGSEASDCARWGVEGVLEGIGDVPGCEQGI